MEISGNNFRYLQIMFFCYLDPPLERIWLQWELAIVFVSSTVFSPKNDEMFQRHWFEDLLVNQVPLWALAFNSLGGEWGVNFQLLHFLW